MISFELINCQTGLRRSLIELVRFPITYFSYLQYGYGVIINRS
jgi:hypothetical protein